MVRTASREHIQDTQQAAERLYEIMDPTALERSIGETANQSGIEVWYKREDQTPVHSFKLRGAYNGISLLDTAAQANGVIAASAGNHAQGVALSAKTLGLEATIVMPETTPDTKVAAVKRFGAQVQLVGDTFDEAYSFSRQLRHETGATYIHPFDDPNVIAGQGVIALETLQEKPDATHLFVPVGGGGLLAGITNYVKALRPDIAVIGVEPRDSSAMTQSLQADSRILLDSVGIFADGVAVKQVGALTFEAAKRADDLVTVEEDELCIALSDFFAETNSKLEPAGALSLAGVQQYLASGKLGKGDVAVAICSGANIDINRFVHVLNRAERISSNTAFLRIGLPERPGALYELCRDTIRGHNIELLDYRKRSGATEAQVSIELRIVGDTDKQQTLDRLDATGHSYLDLGNNSIAAEQGVSAIGDTPNLAEESFYSIEFSDHPGALLKFLEGLGNRWNISMFKYSGSTGDVGRVVIGFEHPDKASLELLLKKHTTAYTEVGNEIVELLG